MVGAMTVDVRHGDCLEVMAKMIADGVRVDSIVCDPPYHLTSIVKRFGKAGCAEAKDRDGLYKRASAGFMGKQWDGGDIAFRVETWALALELLKPGGHLLAFSGTRTYHRMACAIEDAGFEIRDQIGWLYGSGFPKSHDVSKGIDKASGVEVPVKAEGGGSVNAYGDGLNVKWGSRTPHQPFCESAQKWAGWGTALKPAWEPIVLARKPLAGTVVANVLEHGTGALNIDASRVSYANEDDFQNAKGGNSGSAARAMGGWGLKTAIPQSEKISISGRWPANVIHDGSEEVIAAFPDSDGQQRAVGPEHGARSSVNTYGDYGPRDTFNPRGDGGSAARFFYSAKADASDRLQSKHPTVKPVDLMAYLCRLITPPGGLVLDPFAGSGTTGMACMREGFNAILIEREAEYVADIRRRLAHVKGEDTPLFLSAPEETPSLLAAMGGV